MQHRFGLIKSEKLMTDDQLLYTSSLNVPYSMPFLCLLNASASDMGPIWVQSYWSIHIQPTMKGIWQCYVCCLEVRTLLSEKWGEVFRNRSAFRMTITYCFDWLAISKLLLWFCGSFAMLRTEGNDNQAVRECVPSIVKTITQVCTGSGLSYHQFFWFCG